VSKTFRAYHHRILEFFTGILVLLHERNNLLNIPEVFRIVFQLSAGQKFSLCIQTRAWLEVFQKVRIRYENNRYFTKRTFLNFTFPAHSEYLLIAKFSNADIITNMENVKEILDLMKSPSAEDARVIERAYQFADKAHEGQKRFTGDPYVTHSFETAKNLATFGMDRDTIVAGLLHDTLEDGHVTAQQLEQEFGKEVLFLVEGVTKLGRLKYQGVERHVESLRKLFIATAQDMRVLVIKLADRLHNVQTLGGHDRKDKQKRIALETLEIYSPLADRLGMGKLKGELEDEAFPYVYPEEYKKVKELLKERRQANEKYLLKFHRSLQKELAHHGMKTAHIDYRVKRLFSLYKKLERAKGDIEKIYDITALRIIVPTVEDCYKALGIIHGSWRPLPGRIKDYIALPKPNGYQSIHTTVFTGDGGIVEIQIRTEEMHKEAEYGIASHLAYKGGLGKKQRKKGDHLPKNVLWIQQLIEWQKHVSETGEFLEHLKMDFFRDRVFVFTPKGDVIDLPEESTPIDFAYAIHSDIGDHIAGVKINGKMASLDTKLKNGDIIEVITKKGSHPTSKWLEYAKTTLARRNIRSVIQNSRKRN
jgi:guanosine-3',5'-bis(diphosphate) 3'-pyrophosphohydrolase